MANILDPTENLSPVSGLKGIYTKLIEVIRRLNVLLANSGSSKVYKALITQSGTDAPVATVLVNTLSGTPVWSRVSVGYYKLTLASEFTNDKTYYPPFGQMGNILSDGSPGIQMFDDTGAGYGYIQLYKLSTSEFVLKSYNSSFASVDLSDIIGTGNISLPQIEVFP